MLHHGSGASFRSTEQHKVTRVPRNKTSVTVSRGRSLLTACPTEGEADWTIVQKDEHEEEFLQSNDEIAMKVMINEASSLLSVVTTALAPTGDSLRKKRDRHGLPEEGRRTGMEGPSLSLRKILA